MKKDKRKEKNKNTCSAQLWHIQSSGGKKLSNATCGLI